MDLSNATTDAVATSGWTVEIDHADGVTRRPVVLDGVEWQPTINGLPEIRVPVRRDLAWLDAGYEEQSMRVWYNGSRLPIDTLDDVEATPDRYVLVGSGGAELSTRVRAEFRRTEAHVAAQDLIQQETSYIADVDAPPASVSESLIGSADSVNEWEIAIASASNTGGADTTVPYEILNGDLYLMQSANFREAENYDDSAGPPATTSLSGSVASGGEALVLNSVGEEAEYNSLTLDYNPPESAAKLYWRERVPDDGNVGFRFEVNGTTVAERPADALSDNQTEFGWDQAIADFPAYSANVDLVVFEDSSQTGTVEIDCLWAGDDRYSYDFDNSPSGGVLDGPQEYPDQYTVETDDFSLAFALTGGRLESSWIDTSGNQAVAISPDNGATWYETTNGTSVEQDFGQSYTDLRARFTLSRYGTGSTSPADGVNGQRVDLFELFADVDDTPLLLDQVYDGTLEDVLNRIAEYGDFVWELVWDATADSLRIIFTQPGQRTTSQQDGDTSDYNTQKVTSAKREKVVIKGAARRRSREPVTADVGNWVALNNDEIVRGSVSVREASGDQTVYDSDDDFIIDHLDGRFKALSGGQISDGEQLLADYSHRVKGSSATDTFNASTDQTLVENVPGLTTDAACSQSATYLRRRIDDPLLSATISLSRVPTGPPLVESRSFSALPTDDRLDIRNIVQTPQGVDVTTRNRRSAEKIIADIRQRLDALAEQG